MKTVILATLFNSFQAYILKSKLHEEGVVSFMRNETISSIYSIPGFQIEILVFENDYEKAVNIYEKAFPPFATTLDEDIE